MILKIRASREAQLFCVGLANQHRHELGFIPDTLYAHAAEKGHLRTALQNNELAGFVLHGTLKAVTRIAQACIHRDARLHDRARQMVMGLIADCAETGTERVILHCATDLTSNGFWLQTGFKCCGQRLPATTTARLANRWEWVFQPGRDIEAFVADQFRKQSTNELASLFGIRARLQKALEKRYRRSKSQARSEYL